MSVATLLSGKMVLFTGKGGTGKTTFASAFSVVAAAKGKRVLLVEIDNQRPSLTPIFGVRPKSEPKEILPGLSIENLLFADTLREFLRRLIPVRRMVNMALENPILQKFLDFAPGSRELVTLSALAQRLEKYDLVVVDLPASGHAFSLFDILRSASGLFRSGPARALTEELKKLLLGPSIHMVFIAIPEEMVVNETLETAKRMREAGIINQESTIFLNRATLPSLNEHERTLIHRLKNKELNPIQREFIQAGLWEDELEQATATSRDRLQSLDLDGPILVPPVGAGGNPRFVVGQVALHLGRSVGLTKQDIPWN